LSAFLFPVKPNQEISPIKVTKVSRHQELNE